MRLTDFLIAENQNHPYIQGQLGFIKEESCPYDPDTLEYTEWHRGYDDAKAERSGHGTRTNENVNISDFEVSVDFGDGKFKKAGSFYSEQAAKREGRMLCTLDGNGKRYKITYPKGKSKVFTPAGKQLEESEANYIAMSAYNSNFEKAMDNLEMLKLNLMKHRDQYLKTDRRNWGYPGDLEHLNSELEELNDWMRNEGNSAR